MELKDVFAALEAATDGAALVQLLKDELQEGAQNHAQRGDGDAAQGTAPGHASRDHESGEARRCEVDNQREL